MFHAYYYYCYYHSRLHFTKRSQSDFDIVQFLFNVPFHLPFAWPFNGTQCCYDWTENIINIVTLCCALRLCFPVKCFSVKFVWINMMCEFPKWTRFYLMCDCYYALRIAIFLSAFWFENEWEVFYWLRIQYFLWEMSSEEMWHTYSFARKFFFINRDRSIFLLNCYSRYVWPF